jgi:hypothetical protein
MRERVQLRIWKCPKYGVFSARVCIIRNAGLFYGMLYSEEDLT